MYSEGPLICVFPACYLSALQSVTLGAHLCAFVKETLFAIFILWYHILLYCLHFVTYPCKIPFLSVVHIPLSFHYYYIHRKTLPNHYHWVVSTYYCGSRRHPARQFSNCPIYSVSRRVVKFAIQCTATRDQFHLHLHFSFPHFFLFFLYFCFILFYFHDNTVFSLCCSFFFLSVSLVTCTWVSQIRHIRPFATSHFLAFFFLWGCILLFFFPYFSALRQIIYH